VLQVRNPEGDLIHAISWVDKYFSNDDPRTVYLADIPAQIPTMSGLCVSYDGRPNWNDRNNYNINGLPSATPGFPNSVENNKLINKIRTGAFSNVLKVDCVQLEPASQGKKDGKIKISIKGGTPSYGIYIDGADSFYDEIVGNLQKDYFFENLGKGTYKILVEDGGTCYQRFIIKIEETKPICAGECQRIGIDPNDYCSYQWQPHPELTNIDWPEQKVCPEETTVFYLNVVDANGQSQVLNFKVEVKAADITPNPSIICSGQSVTLTVAGNNQSYKWYNGDSAPQIKVDQAGNYGVTVVDAEGCVRKGTANVLSASNPENIKKYFIANGFSYTTNYIVQSIPGKPRNKETEINRGQCFVDYANDEVVDLGLEPIDFNEIINKTCISGALNSHYVTDNESFCSHVYEIENAMSTSNAVGWTSLYHFGDESIIFFKSNLTNANSVPYSQYSRLAKSDIKDYVNLHCTNLNQNLENKVGGIFENTFHAMVSLNYPQWGYDPNPPIFTGNGRNTKPDGLGEVDGTAPHFLIDLNGNVLRSGRVWFEVKNKNKTVYLSTDDGQIRGHIDNIRIEYPQFIGTPYPYYPYGAHFVLISTHPGRLSMSSSVRKYAQGYSKLVPPFSNIMGSEVFPTEVITYNFAAWKLLDANGCMTLIYWHVDYWYNFFRGNWPHLYFPEILALQPISLQDCNCP
jgi:hypothetical protein